MKLEPKLLKTKLPLKFI